MPLGTLTFASEHNICRCQNRRNDNSPIVETNPLQDSESGCNSGDHYQNGDALNRSIDAYDNWPPILSQILLHKHAVSEKDPQRECNATFLCP